MRPADAEAALRSGREARRTVSPFTDADARLDEQWGYDVQAIDGARRTAAGERVIGAKLGLTSVAKQQRMGIHQPIVGFLTDTMRVEPDSPSWQRVAGHNHGSSPRSPSSRHGPCWHR